MMTTTNVRETRPSDRTSRRSFINVVHAEWTKFRTVRGWSIALILAIAVTVLLSYETAAGSHSGTCTSPGVCVAGHPFVPTGPDGEAVADSYYLVQQPLTGDGTISVRVSSLSGVVSSLPPNAKGSAAHSHPELSPWAKAGIILEPSTKQGSSYGAVMVTGGHGVRFQYNYTHDSAGLRGSVSATSPRWLRLVRSGNTVTGYDSTDGRNWTKVGSAHLAGLPTNVVAGFFVASPVLYSGLSSLATATFDHVSFPNNSAQSVWRGQSVGTSPQDFYPTLAAGSYERTGDGFVVSGSGDIAPGVVAGSIASTRPQIFFFEIVVGLIVILVVAVLFVTSEYRRGLIRPTFVATPRRGRVVAAKAIVIGVATFATVIISLAIAIPFSDHVLRSNGNYVYPISIPTEVGIIVGAAALIAVAAITVMALAAVLRNSAGAIGAGIVIFVFPFILAMSLSGGAVDWLLRLTPAAAFSVMQNLPRSPLVSFPYTFANGYYPLAPWAGLGVLCVYAALSLGLATVLLRRRDA